MSKAGNLSSCSTTHRTHENGWKHCSPIKLNERNSAYIIIFINKTDLIDFYEEFIPIKYKMSQLGAVFNQDDPKNLGVDNYIFVKWEN